MDIREILKNLQKDYEECLDNEEQITCNKCKYIGKNNYCRVTCRTIDMNYAPICTFFEIKFK